MDEARLIEQVLRIINANYSNIYVADIQGDKVYVLVFSEDNNLIVKETITYTDFIDRASGFVHEEDLSSYFDAISLSKLEEEFNKGNRETKVKYRCLCPTGEYRWYVNIINYLNFDNKRLLFMMSDDINERLIDVEVDNIRLANEVDGYKTRITQESESIGDAIYQINNLIENSKDDKILTRKDTREYINSLFSKVSLDHPELNKVIIDKMVDSNNYMKPCLLIVDDSSIIRNSLKKIFDSEYTIVMATTGDEAIRIINESAFNLLDSKDNIVGVLLDLVMPVSDGFAVLDYMKKNNLLKKIPVAIISGDETKETRRRVYEYDIVDMLEKPFNTENIRRRLGKIISLYSASDNLNNLLLQQSRELESQKALADVKGIIKKITDNVSESSVALRMKNMTRIIASGLAKMPDYDINDKYIDAIVKGVPLYNIGAIAMREDIEINTNTIREEIANGINISSIIIDDEYELNVVKNIINYSCEMYNGSGFPNGIKGSAIPIEAQIANVVVRLVNGSKSILNNIKAIVAESDKYNPDLIKVINSKKKDLKGI